MKPALLIVLLLTATASQAQVYKWVDAKGVVHYTDNKFEAGDAPITTLKPMAPAYRPRQLQSSNCLPDARTVCR